MTVIGIYVIYEVKDKVPLNILCFWDFLPFCFVSLYIHYICVLDHQI